MVPLFVMVKSFETAAVELIVTVVLWIISTFEEEVGTEPEAQVLPVPQFPVCVLASFTTYEKALIEFSSHEVA